MNNDKRSQANQAASSEASITRTVPAVRRAAAILWILAKSPQPLSLSKIAGKADILPSTALHILREMMSSQLIAFDPASKLYRLGQGIVDLAQAVIGMDGFTEVCRPYLQAISSRFGVTATATATVDEQHTACVVSISSASEMSLNVTLGGRVPTLSGATGRCIAAYGGQTSAQLKRGFERIRWQAPLAYEAWIGEVNEVPAQGYAEDDGLFALGVMTLAAPVFDRYGIVSRAIGIVTISAAIEAETKRMMALALVDAAAKISKEIQR